MDDNKLSHEDPKVVIKILEVLRNQFGYLVINRGNTHAFLGIDIKIRDDKKIEIDIKYQIQ